MAAIKLISQSVSPRTTTTPEAEGNELCLRDRVQSERGGGLALARCNATRRSGCLAKLAA